MTRRRALLLASVSSVLSLLGMPAVLAASPPGASHRASATVSGFDAEPVVLTGADFPGWTSGPEVTARAPQPPTDYEVYDYSANEPSQLRSDCYQSSPTTDVNGSKDSSHNDHQCFQGSQSPVRTVLKGVPANSLLGYRWDGARKRFVQIPFQVDTKWEHYISNNASGFAFYSGVDQMLTYTFDREPFLYTSNPKFNPSDPTDVCQPSRRPDSRRPHRIPTGT